MDADPYWVRAWPSALALASTVLDSPELVRGKRVADLGAGLGVAGIAAALAGAPAGHGIAAALAGAPALNAVRLLCGTKCAQKAVIQDKWQHYELGWA
eukprot:scaffold95911_cov19-Tisochrysis_lutea.AAC.2